MRLITVRILLLAAIAMPCGAFAADSYWAYSYQGMEVTAVGGEEFARNIAHNLHRLDRSLAAILQTRSDGWRAPTLIYVVPAQTFEMLYGKKDSTAASYTSNAFENNVLINASSNGDDRYWGVYFGLTGSVLNSAFSFRYPTWFVHGLSEVFAGTSINHFSVTIGGINRGRVYTLLHRAPIPIKTLLALRSDDPQLSSREFLDMYAAEAWFLVHQIVIEKQYHTNFFEYFQRLDKGEDEAHAFAESFTVSYEDLDKMLASALGSGRISVIKVELADEKDESVPRRLSDAEAKGRLAMYAAEHSPQADVALNLSTQSLGMEPHGEDAQIARILALLKQTDYAAALHSSEALCGAETLSQKVAAQCGWSFSRLAAAVSAKQVSLEIDAAGLGQRSEQYFEKALAGDGEDLESWYRLIDSVAGRHDKDYAKELLPRAERVQAAHPRMGILARAVALLCASTGDYATAIGYATIWERNALSGQDRASASTYLSTLRTYLERRAPKVGSSTS